MEHRRKPTGPLVLGRLDHKTMAWRHGSIRCKSLFQFANRFVATCLAQTTPDRATPLGMHPVRTGPLTPNQGLRRCVAAGRSARVTKAPGAD